MDNLEYIIRKYIEINEYEKTPAGWYPVLCKVCNDHGKKGKRAGFRFEPDGSVYYHCFNCGPSMNAGHVPGERLSKKFHRILLSFGIPEEELKVFNFHQFGKNKTKTQNNEEYQKVSLPKEVSFPLNFIPINQYNEKIHSKHIRYVEKRSIDYKTANLYLCNDPHDKNWYTRIIFPIICFGKLRGYIGRSIIPNEKRKYKFSKGLQANKVLINFDQIFHQTDKPLILCEGPFDAYSINGVAILGNAISEFQKYWINQTKRKIIFVPDQFGNGFTAAKQAIENGWYISIPEIGSCKDINDSVMKYGKLYTLKTIYDNVYKGTEGLIKAKVFCKK